MKKVVIIMSVFLFGTAFSIHAQEMPQKVKNNYAIGVLLGEKISEEIQKSGMDMSVFETIKEKIKDVIDFESINFQFIKEGFSDILKGECKIQKEEVEAVFVELQEKVESIKKMFEEQQSESNVSESGSSSCVQSTKAAYLYVLANHYGSLSWNYLFIKEFKQAEQSAIKALKLDPTQIWVKTNLAHALLFQNKFSKAEKIYKELSLMKRNKNETYKQLLLEDFDTLEKAGAIPEKQKANVEKIRKKMRE